MSGRLNSFKNGGQMGNLAFEGVLATLSPRERDVLRLRYGLDDGRMKTLEELELIIRKLDADAYDWRKDAIEENYEIAKKFHGENDVVPRLTRKIIEEVNNATQRIQSN